MDIKVGDTVRLKGGTTKMIVGELLTDFPIGGPTAECYWEDNKGKHMQKSFPLAVLEKVT